MISRINLYKLLPWAVTCLLITPILALILSAFQIDDSGSFQHLIDTVLWDYSLNTLLMVLGVITLSCIFALPVAWFVACCEFPGRSILQWALMLPLALPPYIIAIVYTDLMDFSGPVQHFLRALMGWQQTSDYYFPDIRTISGAIIILSLALYPYLYLLLRGAFLGQSGGLFQAARTLGLSPMRAFLRVSLPLSRTALAVGLSLIAMETLGDFATVHYFSVSTLTTAVYNTWLELGSLTTAAKISSLMLLALVILISLENYSRRRQKLYQGSGSTHTELRFVLQGWQKWGVLSFSWGLLFFAFILPLAVLFYYASLYFSQSFNLSLWKYTLNSVWLATIVASLALLIALIVNFYQRLSPGVSAKATIRLSSLGYALPGTVVAIAVLIPFTSLDLWLNRQLVEYGYSRVGLLFSGTLFILVAGYLVRFSAIAVGSIDSSLAQVSPSLDSASRTLGQSAAQTIRRVDLPLITRGMLSAFILVFIEAMKELPTALLLRPFNFETLATYAYQFVSDEMIEYAALPALLIVLIGLVPFIVVSRLMEKSS
ncbi:iron(III) ABC transporter, inner membrane binding component [Psychromonas ingrahamii 37]|uniref:Iron(III) ABC transporter, inner membrane binding component n=1 Tax=Psychromonas ingrahamii (strain DSM 17664 / CCUG 51855 / 37) TaxID=357804 RepID=A1SYZ3_PSYIN|nr:iron ABC transporter permease [Psychromonas ingrahamii]ABM04708.1 iron(III) ABC transporter, inner membrane binding component [Psychromonas ingrahamii 37]